MKYGFYVCTWHQLCKYIDLSANGSLKRDHPNYKPLLLLRAAPCAHACACAAMGKGGVVLCFRGVASVFLVWLPVFLSAQK